jgi:hypothetical protein
MKLKHLPIAALIAVLVFTATNASAVDPLPSWHDG